MDTKKIKKNIIQAGRIAVDELIKVAKEPIIDFGPDISADRLKNAADTKKLAIFDAFDILYKINEEEKLEGSYKAWFADGQLKIDFCYKNGEFKGGYDDGR